MSSGRTGRVIVVGAVNVDLVMRLPRLPGAGETVLGGTLTRHHGGKGANQAVAAARAGAPTHLISAVGAADGQQPVDALGADGVDVGGVLRCDAPTGHAFVLVDAGSAENQIAVAPGASALLPAEHVRACLAGLKLGRDDVVVLSFEVPLESLQAAARMAGAAGTRVVVNPAPARAGYGDLLVGAITTPNRRELAELAALLPGGARRGAGRPRAAARALAHATGAPVVATMGADGALLADAGGCEHFPGHRVVAADTTGAGDALTGALAASLALGHDLRGSMRRAVAAAALAVTGPGARGAIPTAAETERLLGGGTGGAGPG